MGSELVMSDQEQKFGAVVDSTIKMAAVKRDNSVLAIMRKGVENKAYTRLCFTNT